MAKINPLLLTIPASRGYSPSARSPNGQFQFSFGADTRLRLEDMVTRQSIPFPRTSRIPALRQVEFTADNRWLMVEGRDGLVQIWDVFSGDLPTPKLASQYDPARASFKTWLMRLTHWRILKQIHQRQRIRSVGPVPPDFLIDESLEDLPDPAGINLEAVWETEWQKHLYSAALEEVKKKVSPSQMQLFDLYVTQQWSVPEICRSLRISATRVYLAKHRISRLIEKEVRRLEKGGL